MCNLRSLVRKYINTPICYKLGSVSVEKYVRQLWMEVTSKWHENNFELYVWLQCLNYDDYIVAKFLKNLCNISKRSQNI